jgi:hypothetical protein
MSMHRRAHHVVSLAALVALAAAVPLVVDLAGQQIVIQDRPMGPRTGPRDNQAPQTGTARLRGRIVGGESGQALRRAVVRLQGQEFREGRVASTDEEGRWEIKDLPAGRYNLTASKGGYVQLNYGQRRPFERGRPIELADGQTLENVNFNLPRGAVIAGRVIDEFGEPVADAMVSALHYRSFNGRRRLVPVGRFGSTDDMGHFRLFGLAPGDYYVSATLQSMGMMGFGAQGENSVGYAPTYYPGTGSAQQADRISVGLGGETSGITFSLLPVRTAKVSGMALDSSGKPMAGAFVMLMADQRTGDGGFMMFGAGGNQVKDDGTFVISNVTPGDYVVRAMAGGPRRGDDDESATASVSVGGEDVTGVMLVGTKGTSLRGQVVVQPASAATGIKPTDVSVNVMAKDPDAPMMFMGPMMRDRVDDDWSFEVKALQSPALIRAFRTPPGYSLKAVLLNGIDVTDSGVTFKAGEAVNGLQVVLSTTSSGIAGAVTDDRGKPAVDYAAIVFAEDSAKWGFMSRHVGLARPDQQGGFQVKNLPPGHYLAVAVDAVEEGQETDPEFLERLRSLATPFILSEGEQRSVSLKLVQAN